MVGGGVCGLGAGLLLARDGHDVVVLERDADALPDTPPNAWESWDRAGVAQFRQPHNLMPGLRLVLEKELPDIQEALPRHGAAKWDFSKPLPRTLADQQSPARSTRSCGPTPHGVRSLNGCSRMRPSGSLRSLSNVAFV